MCMSITASIKYRLVAKMGEVPLDLSRQFTLGVPLIVFLVYPY